MDNSTYVALSLAQAMERELDMTANNMANANTAGFKGEHMIFESYLLDGAGVQEGEDISFVLDKGSFLDTTQGPVSQTANPLDLALLGQGWFSYETTDGQLAYGRDGRFTLDTQGNIITLNGSRLLDVGGGSITVPQDAGELTIARDGTISSAANGVLGQIGVFDLPDLQSLELIGGGMFVRPDGSKAPLQVSSVNTEVVQGSIEGSNIEPVMEMTRLMQVQRAYERAINLMNDEDDLRQTTLQRLNNVS